jgi:DNA helicase-2/ATP-dependent DNA helicase PcrA
LLPAVSAVPGLGSHGVAAAAAIHDRPQSTSQLPSVGCGDFYAESAAANIKIKIRDRLKKIIITPRRFVVNTLHGLALNIALSDIQFIKGLNLENSTFS